MMSSSTSLDQRRADPPVDYLDRAREIAPMLAAAADEIEERRELPERIVKALIERGFFRMLLPRSLGGAELDPVTYVQVLEEIAKADPSTAWCLGQNSGCSMTAPYLDPAVAREIFGPPRGILAWGPELPGAGRGVAVDGGIRVTGRWGFATGSRHATWLGAHVPIFEPDGTPRLNPNGRPFVRTVLFPKTSAEIIDNWQVIGPRGTRKTLRENNVIQSEVAQSEAKLRSARAFIHATLAEMWDEAKKNGDFARDQHARL